MNDKNCQQIVEELTELVEFCKQRRNMVLDSKNDDITKKSLFSRYEGMMIAYAKAIEIVEHGGVSDYVCEWHFDEYGRWHTECHYLADNDPLEYTYCPYCGKKIKVVE